MARFVPKDKLSKKAQKELNRQRRTMWDFSPVSRTVDSMKLYNQKRIARNRDDYGPGDLHFHHTRSTISVIETLPSRSSNKYMITHVGMAPGYTTVA